MSTHLKDDKNLGSEGTASLLSSSSSTSSHSSSSSPIPSPRPKPWSPFLPFARKARSTNDRNAHEYVNPLLHIPPVIALTGPQMGDDKRTRASSPTELCTCSSDDCSTESIPYNVSVGSYSSNYQQHYNHKEGHSIEYLHGNDNDCKGYVSSRSSSHASLQDLNHRTKVHSSSHSSQQSANRPSSSQPTRLRRSRAHNSPVDRSTLSLSSCSEAGSADDSPCRQQKTRSTPTAHSSYGKLYVRFFHSQGLVWYLLALGLTMIFVLSVVFQSELDSSKWRRSTESDIITVLFPRGRTAFRGNLLQSKSSILLEPRSVLRAEKVTLKKSHVVKQVHEIQTVHKPSKALHRPPAQERDTVLADWHQMLPPVHPSKPVPSSLHFDRIDRHLYSKHHHSTRNKGHSRVFVVDELSLFVPKHHRTLELYPADYTDATQLYGLLDSSDERLKLMEPRQPYENGECVPMKEWQTTFHPYCNGVHELGVEYLGASHGNDFTLFGIKGFWRNAWKVGVRNAEDSQDPWDTIVLKTLR
jgi:hypothetical protein